MAGDRSENESSISGFLAAFFLVGVGLGVLGYRGASPIWGRGGSRVMSQPRMKLEVEDRQTYQNSSAMMSLISKRFGSGSSSFSLSFSHFVLRFESSLYLSRHDRSAASRTSPTSRRTEQDFKR